MGLDELTSYFTDLWLLLVKHGPARFVKERIAKAAWKEARNFVVLTAAFIALILSLPANSIDLSGKQMLAATASLIALIAIESAALRLSWICVGGRAPFVAFFIADCYFWGVSLFFASVLLAVTYVVGRANLPGRFGEMTVMVPLLIVIALPLVLLWPFWKIYRDETGIPSSSGVRSVAALVLFVALQTLISVAVLAVVEAGSKWFSV